MIKRAFTLTELIFVIIIVGIISVVASTRFSRDTMTPAAIQVLDHVRYTQQLALNADKFTPSPEFSTAVDAAQDSEIWYDKWWHIHFFADTTYLVTSDLDHDGVLDPGEGAIDPQSGLVLDGATNPLLDLGEEYGITSVTVGGACADGDQILFDRLGRPHCARFAAFPPGSPYANLANANITITLTNGTEARIITIVPITGYASLN